MEFATTCRKQSRLTDVRYRIARAGWDRWSLLDGLPVTTALATIDDLAAGHLVCGHLVSVVRDAVNPNLVDTDDLIGALGQHAHRYGITPGDGAGLLDRLLTEAGRPESTLALSRRLVADGTAADIEATASA